MAEFFVRRPIVAMVIAIVIVIVGVVAMRALPIAQYCEEAGCPEEQVREAARVIANANSVAMFEDLGVQMNRNSTLVSYLHYLIAFGTGNYGVKGSKYPVSSLQQILQAGPDKGETAPVTGTPARWCPAP